MQRTSYDVQGGVLAGLQARPAQASGSVLLVPGFTGSKEDFAPVLEPICQSGLAAIAIDQRGQYESPGPDDPTAYTVPALAADVLAVASGLPGPVHLVGHSFGGLVSRYSVLLEPGRFASLVLMGSGPAGLTGPRVEPLQQLRPLVAAGGIVAVADASDALSAADVSRPPQPPELRAFLRSRFLASSAAGLLAMADALMGEPDRIEALRATGVPVLVLHGEQDDAWTPALQAEMARRLDAAHTVIPAAMHSPAVESPGPTAAAMLRFWQGLTGS